MKHFNIGLNLSFRSNRPLRRSDLEAEQSCQDMLPVVRISSA